MSRAVSFAPEAEAQLAALYRYLARESSPEIADRYTSAILDRCEALADFPMQGTPRDDLRLGIRTVAFRRGVTIAYLIEANAVTNLGLFYGGFDIAGAFEGGF